MSYALITGASSGIGYEAAKQLNNLGYDLILVARRLDKLNELKETLKGNILVLSYDLSKENDIYSLIDNIKNYDIKVFINNAGFGDCGYIKETSFEKELNMIDLNIRGLYILTKKAIEIMNDGYILNVASVAGILHAGPYMSQYYGTKAYVRSFTEGISFELKEHKSKLSISALCPGPVKTEFDKNANVNFSLKGITAKKCVSYALKKMFKKKVVIIPGGKVRFLVFFQRLLSRKSVNKIIAKSQKKKVL